MTINVDLDNIPKAISPKISMSSPNEKIEIFKGVFQVEKGTQSLELDGNVYFKWLPSPQVIFKGSTDYNLPEFVNLHENEESIEIKINEDSFGTGSILDSSSGSSNKNEYLGTCRNGIKGDKSINVDHVHFEIVNLRYFKGRSVKSEKALYKARLCLDSNDFEIILDQNYEYRKFQKALRSEGGYITLYSGMLKPKKGSISFNDSKEVFSCLSKYLTFLNGRRVSPIFRSGVFEDQTKWIDYTPYINDPYKFVISWPPEFDIDHLNNLWQEFYKLWKKDNDRNCLNTVIHWYVEANNNSGYIEGSIVMIQNALELLYNWIIVERIGMIKGDDANNIAAANKLRLLLSNINLGSGDVPEKLSKLSTYAKNKKLDGPDVFTQIRNAVVHGNFEKRNILKSLDPMVMYEAKVLGLWYLELILLHTMSYSGKYFNRTTQARNIGDGEESMPWV